jgi:hypothetical protein
MNGVTLFRSDMTHPNWEGEYFKFDGDLPIFSAYSIVSTWRERRSIRIDQSARGDYVKRFNTTMCADPVDRSYAMLGLIPRHFQVPVD